MPVGGTSSTEDGKRVRLPALRRGRVLPISTRDLYECRYCRHQASLTAGTVMEKTRTPLRVWFFLIFLMANQKTGLSVLGASRMLGIP